MSLEHLAGREYGPFEFELSAAKVGEYVSATGDDPQRWTEHAPPSYAGAVLFKAAPAFLFDPDVAAHARLLIHGEQVFAWPNPWRIGSQVVATAVVDRIRERGGVTFATFLMEVTDDDARLVLTAKSVFLMSEATPPGGNVEERVEPPAEQKQADEVAGPIALQSEDEAFISMKKSASRADLVRYAAASEDFNPMHWDHDRAQRAGVGGVICHGLLMAAWATQPVTSLTTRPDPLVEARFRFRLPLYPDDSAMVRTFVADRRDGRAGVKSTVVTDSGEHMASTMTMNTGGS